MVNFYLNPGELILVLLALALALIPFALPIPAVILYMKSKKYQKANRKTSDLLWAAIAFAGVFIPWIYLLANDSISPIVMLSMMFGIVTIFIIMLTISILYERRITFLLWSLCVSIPSIVSALAVESEIMIFLHPIFIIISMIAIGVMLTKKRRQTKNVENSEE